MALATRNPACPYIFQYRGKQLRSPRTGFENARHSADLDHVMIHDLRRTAVRNMIKAGIDPKRAMQISGHKTENVFRRYDIVAEDEAIETGQTMRGYMEKQKLVPKLVPDVTDQGRKGGPVETGKLLN